MGSKSRVRGQAVSTNTLSVLRGVAVRDEWLAAMLIPLAGTQLSELSLLTAKLVGPPGIK